MGIEIERKFLVCDDSWRSQVMRSASYRQGYLGDDTAVSVRVRICGDRANLNLKSATLDLRRVEFEYPIPLEDASVLLGYATGSVVEKTRHFVEFARHTWEIDVFSGANSGLVVAEIELSDENEAFDKPPWLGREVSDDPRYYNVCLARHPYREWRQ